MRRIVFIVAICVALVFIAALFSAKPIVRSLLKETEINYTPQKEQSVELKNGDYVLFGQYLGENILWRVCDTAGDMPLLQTEYVISFKAFDASHGDGSDIGKMGKAQWETCTLNKWLNTRGEVDYGEVVPDDKSVFNGKNSYENEQGFLSENNFSESEYSMISQQGVFILSKDRCENISAESRMKTASKTAILQDESNYIITSNRKVWYWTSSAAGTNRTSVVTVNSGGGFYKGSAFDGVTGVVPALYLKSTKAVSVYGDGSREKPFAIKAVTLSE